MYRILMSALCLCGLSAAEPVHPNLPFDHAKMTLVDEVDLSLDDPGHRYTEVPAGSTTTTSILDRRCRVLTNAADGVGKYFAVRLGEGKGLTAGKAYVLELTYPEDAPRTIYVANKGCDTRSGFHTGTTLGDAGKPPYINPNNESIDMPLAGKWQTWTQYFHLHDRSGAIKVEKENPNPLTPADGFWVVILHNSHDNAPLSQGAAVATLRLYEAPKLDDIAVDLKLPKDLPQRHLFYREEMADGVFGNKNPDLRGVREGVTWYEYHARLMRFLGMNTFSKDLLEFGHNQGWDSTKYGSNDWVYQNSTPDMWSKMVPMVTSYGLNLLPMYEYCGSVGNASYGKQRRARTLHQAKKGKDGADDYTHIWWSEKCNVDITDPETVDDLRKILEITIADEAKNGNFVGAWLRPRSSAWPVSFSDRCLAQFAKDTNHSGAVTRKQLIDDQKLYQAYWAWWYDQRKVFLNNMRDIVRSDAFGIGKDAALLVTLDPAEAGVTAKFPSPSIVTDDPSRFAGTDFKPQLFADVLAAKTQLTAQTSLHGTWGGWEWQHAVPPNDPERYRDNAGVLQTWTFNRLYTVSDDSMDAFRTPDGLAMIRHYCLNEHALPVNGDKDPIGYFVMDVEYAGPYSMLAEARALANGDPRFIGYLAGNCFNRGFPQYARAFNQAFLALPAIPSTRLAKASTNADVVVRSYDAGSKGTWFAIINTGLNDATDVTITLPSKKPVVDCLTGKAAPKQVSLYPGQVLAWQVR